MAYIRLPNNRYFPIAEGETPEQAMQVAQQKYPKAFMSEKELEDKQGFGAAVGEAWRGAKAAGYEGAGKLFNSETLKKASEEEYRKLREEPGFIPTTSEDRDAAFKKGLFSGIGALGREYISEPVGGIVGRYGAPIAAGALATAAAPVTGVGALGAGVIGGAVTAAADYLPQVGENLERQRKTGKTESVSDAALTAIPQAALSGLNLRLGMLPKGVQNIFKADAAALQKQVVSGALKPEAAVAQLSGNLKNILLSTGSAAVVGTGTMVGEEALRRGQAGQSVMDAEALGDYGTIAKDAALLAPLFGVPRGALKRRGEVKGIEAAGKQRADIEGIELRAKQDAEAALAAEDAFRAEQASTIGPKEDAAAGVQGRTGDLFAEPMRTEGPAKGKEAFGKMEGDVSLFRPSDEAQLKAQLNAGRIYDQRTVAERERVAQEQGVEAQTPFEAERQRDLLAKRVEEIEVRVASAASKGDIDTITGLNEQLVQSRNALKEAEVAAKAAGPIEMSPAQQLEKLQADLAKSTKELQKAGDLGDFDKITALTPKLKDLQTKIAEIGQTGPDLYAVEDASKVRGKAEAQAALEQGQLDLMAQTRQPVPRVETRQQKILDRYQDSVRQLDEAYAANADKRIIDQLVEKVREAGAARSAQIARTSDTRTLDQQDAAQQRADRITSALKEAVVKAEEMREPLMKKQLRAVRALEKKQAAFETSIQEAKDSGATKRELSALRKNLDAEIQQLKNKADVATKQASRPYETVKQLEQRLANAQVSSARPPVESRRSKALEDQMGAIESLRSSIEDLRSGRYLGEGARDPSMAASLRTGVERQAIEAIGKYVEAAIRDVQAVRERNGQKPMTVTEATRMAMDVRGHLENAVRNKNQATFALPKGDIALQPTQTIGVAPQKQRGMELVSKGSMSPIERQLAQIKKKYHKGEALVRRGPEQGLRLQFETGNAEVVQRLEKLRKEGKAETAEYRDLLEREGGKQFDINKPLETEQRRAAQETEERADEAGKRRAFEKFDDSDQLALFGAREFSKEVGAVRATPENFQRLLRSDVVQKLRAAEAAIEKKKAEAAAEINKPSKDEVRIFKIQKSLRATEAEAEKLENAKALRGKLSTAIEKTEKLKKKIASQIPRAINPERAKLIKQRENLNKLSAEQKQKLSSLDADIKKMSEDVDKDKPLENFAQQVRKQREVVKELANAEELAGNLRNNAQQLWRQTLIANDNLKKAEAETKSAVANLQKAVDELNAHKKDLAGEMKRAEGNPAFAEEQIGKVKKAIKETEKEIGQLSKKYSDALTNEGKAADVVEKIRSEASKRTAEIDRFNTRAAELFEGNIAAERKLLERMESRLARMSSATPKALALEKEMVALRLQIAESEKNQKAAATQRDKQTRELEEARAEAISKLPVTRRETVSTQFKTENAAAKKKRDDLVLKLEQETKSSNPDEKKIARLKREIEAVETRQEVLRTKITKEVPSETAALRREKSLEAQTKAADELAQKAMAKEKASPASRTALVDALRQESKVAADLKEVRTQIEKVTNVVTGLAKAVKDSTKPALKKSFETRLENARKAKQTLVEKEAVLAEKYADLRKVGVGVERSLEAVGNKPGRERRVKVKSVPLTPEQTAARKAAQAQTRTLSNDFQAYLESEKRDKYDYYDALSGVKFRAQEQTTSVRIDATLAKQVADAIEKNAPKDVNLKSVATFAELPPSVKKLMERRGIVDGSAESESVRGFVTPDGDVYVIRGNHESVKDMERTYVHELIGHAGVDRILGKEGMEELTKRVNAQGGAMELARKLGVEDNVQGAMYDYALGIETMTKNKASKADIDKALKDMETQAVRELLAYTAEKRVDENFKQKAGRWVQEVIGAVRAALRKMGLMETAKLSTADIFNILRQSQRNYNKGQLGAFRDTNGNMAFSSKPIYSANIPAGEVDTVGKAIAQDKPFKDRVKGNALGMSMMHRFVDRFAGLEYIARTMRDKLEGVQMMYFNRMVDQRNNMIAEIATHGSVKLEKNTDGTYQYKSRKGPSLKNVFESVNKAKSEFGNAQATLNYFGAYLAMERAASNKGGLKAGLEKLDLSGKFSEAEANAIIKRGRANTHFQEARKSYREYNNGMIDLMVESGRLSKEQAAELKKGDYVPYYRDKGGEIIDMENNIRVGDIKTQAYLKELIGGDSAIVNFETGALQNTYMLTDMAMSNIAAKNTAYTLTKLGMAEVKNGSGSAKANIIRFYENGVQKHAEINTSGNYIQIEERLDKMRAAGKANTPEYKRLRERAETARASEGAFGDIPAELIVKGMEGVASAMPAGVAMMRGPANLLRKAVTRNPAYAVRIALKDSLSGWVTSGADVKPFVSIMGGIKKSWQGDAPEVRSLQSQGIIGGHAFAGTMSDMRTIAQQIAQGQSGWEKLWAKTDRMAIMADEAQRVSLYNGFIKKGMSDIEASLATLESANFTKHGYSPTVKALSTMIPFFNAQIQGLNVFARAISGTSLFQDKLGVREKMLKRGMMLAGATMAYSALMQNNEAYKNATETDKLNYWFVPLPFMDEPVRVPIPFEAGAVFKAIPEAVYNLMATDSKSKDVLPAVGRLALNSIPGMSNMFLPQGIKPVIELTTGTSFFTLEDIESARQKAELPGYRSGTNTTEFSKTLGKALNVSPIQIDYAVNAYTSGLGIALLSMFNPLLRDASAPESKFSQLPIVGGFAQPTDGAGLINKAYEDMQSIEQVNRTFKNLEEKDPDQADKFLDKYLDKLDKVSAAGKFKKEMGDLNKEERIIRSDTSLTAAQKRSELDEIKQLKIEIAKEFMSISRE